jgi:carbon monoxide dehydrogenase subunit G
MNFAGEQQFDCGQAELWARLNDMAFVARVIPDVDRVERIAADGFTCKVRPRFSFLTGALELTFELVERAEPQRLKVRSRGKGIGATVIVDAEIHLAAGERGAVLRWTGTIVSREGLLKPVSPALLQAAAQRVIDNFWQKFRVAIAESNGGVGGRIEGD